MNQPKRILFVMDALDMSGVAFSALNLAVGLRRPGTHVMVLARTGGERESMFREIGVRVDVVKYMGIPLLGHAAHILAASFQPEIVHAQSMPAAKAALAVARKAKVPLVVTANRLDVEECVFPATHPEAGVIAVSNAIQERLANQGHVSRERIRVIPNGLDLEHFPSRDLEAGAAERRHVPVIGAYGTLAERKGQRILLQAAGKLLHTGVDAEFVVVGHGPDKPELRRLATELGIANRVTFTPSTSSDGSQFANLDVFVEPTFQEGLGLSVLQAMATGVPVVASGVGGIFSLVEDGETGMLVPAGDSEALAKAIRELLSDPARRLELARRARARVEKDFSAESVADRVLDFYAERIAAAAGPAA